MSRKFSHPALSQPVLLAVGFVILIVVSGVSVWLVKQYEADSNRVLRTLEVKEKLSELQRLVWRAESHQRGFLLTGQAAYRDEFGVDVDEARAALAEIRSLLAGSMGPAGQEQHVRDLDAAVAAHLARLVRVAELRERRDVQSVLPAVRGSLAQSRTEEIRTIIEHLIGHEQDILIGQIGTSRRRGQLLLFVSLAGAALIVGLGTLSVTMVNRSLGQLRTAQTALQETNESLEATVSRRTAELRQANQEIQQFAHIVSHDLRSPLVNIMGFTGELETVRKQLFDHLSSLRARLGDDAEPDRQLAQEFDEALGFIKNSIERMDRLIKAILKLTREGHRVLRLEPIGMTDLVRDIAAGFSYQAQEAGATITIEELPPCTSDRLAIEQIFANLLENALKYLRDDRPGQIQVTGRSAPAELAYEVQDNGRGIAEKDRERIFEIFRRSGPHNRPGEGIGLTHVRTLVRRIGGTITVQSELGKGSTFTVTLPRPAASRPPETTL